MFGAARGLRNALRFNAVADFEAIAGGIFKEDGVVPGFIIDRAFDVPRAGPAEDFAEAIYFSFAFSPEGNTRFVGHVRG